VEEEVKHVRIVKMYGTMWARNKENINRVPSVADGGVGIYVLFDGSMPVYVGKGNLKSRLRSARRSGRRGELWDRFSWYALTDPKLMHDIEVLVLRILPPYLRALTRQDGHFLAVRHGRPQSKNRTADAITRRWGKTSKA
jgi:hypothetical protein